MSKSQRSALIMTITGLMSVLFLVTIGLSQTVRSPIQLTTSPPVGQFYPFEAEATKPQSPTLLTLTARNSAGELLANSLFKVQIFTPPNTPFLATDFPVVEGTTLLELAAIAPEGKVQFQQMLPIRGKYKLLVNVTPIAANQFSPIEQTLTLDVPENPVKYRNYAILLVVLLAVGIGGGWVMGKQSLPQRGEIAPVRVRLLLSGAVLVAIASLLVVNVSAEVSKSHDHFHATPEETTVSNNSQLQVQISGDNYARVGELANLQVSAIDAKTNQPLTDVTFKLKTTQLEDNWVAFAYEGIPDATGKLKWQQQFFDGAPHKLEVEAIPNSANSQFKPIVATEEIEVAAVATPLPNRLISFGYLIGTVIIGLAIGLTSRRRILV
ncbi:hypothetical protein [Chlorogloea sp. CCALA 695]|uniref:hypothetical protein n=1 Tax=Chlorogloea sp. CCALA 695 TaxID=2107693 RepID=UPI000D06E121|nr:hypothetical protein [Chlorogloea sp. CCALA 695]PSB31700.1 hypothetical protein C7B70_12570 [Chlorogloea sp. CCALA 695]